MNEETFQFSEDGSPMRQIREALGMTQQDFAVAIGVSVTTVARWERGERNPMFTIAQIKALEKLIKTIGLKIKDLPDELGVSPT